MLLIEAPFSQILNVGGLSWIPFTKHLNFNFHEEYSISSIVNLNKNLKYCFLKMCVYVIIKNESWHM